jgi:hypothetical protein
VAWPKKASGVKTDVGPACCFPGAAPEQARVPPPPVTPAARDAELTGTFVFGSNSPSPWVNGMNKTRRAATRRVAGRCGPLTSLACLLAAVAAATCGGRPSSNARADGATPEYQVRADGNPAPIAQRWTISASSADDAPAAAMGTASGAALCNSQLFLADPRHGAVHEIDLRTGRRVRAIGLRSATGDGLSAPESLAADCARGRLYVADTKAIIEFEISSGTVLRRIPKPPQVRLTLGRSLVEEESLVLSGLWMEEPDAWLDQPLDRVLRGAAIGQRYHLASAGAAPLLDLLSEACRSRTPECLYATLDRIDGDRAGWIGCQAGASDVGVFAEDGALVRRIDARSPMFRQDGQVLDLRASAEARAAWHRANSMVYSCWAFRGIVVTIHRVVTADTWTPGQQMPSRVFLNAHTVDGVPLVADLLLYDLPLLRDERSLYLVRYGGANTSDGLAETELQRIEILDASGTLHPALLGPETIVSSGGLRPSDSPTRSLARRFAGALRSRGSFAGAHSRRDVWDAF